MGACTHLAPPDIESVCRAVGVAYTAELLDTLDQMQRTALPILNKPADKPR
jgi:hypothetical protein